ncbi:hypothetical protein Vadar_022734 [Vaccinium darrowii]|uniref:Uncharacterized protein n=1 Tax=Vaccinium darrowii TaxID=229202 RepID=A0ACB7Y890_9ERIC|nr:hypothetical protein Vadar_022734 [Vaccinium darrowii]
MEFEQLGMGNDVIEFDMMGLGEDTVDIEHQLDDDDGRLIENSYGSGGSGGAIGELYIPEGDTNLEPYEGMESELEEAGLLTLICQAAWVCTRVSMSLGLLAFSCSDPGSWVIDLFSTLLAGELIIGLMKHAEYGWELGSDGKEKQVIETLHSFPQGWKTYFLEVEKKVSKMEFLDLFIVALMPILKILIVTAIGLFLAIERVNLLGPVARHHLNNLVFYVFSPALVVSNLADTITSSNVVSLWFMPVNILLTFIIGSALGWILVKITRTPKHLHGLVIGCCSSGNLGNLLLIIVPAVCDESNSPFGDSSTCTTNGDAYASLSMAIGAVCIWTYAYNIIRISTSKRNDSISPGETSESLTEPLVSKHSQRPEDYEAQAESPPTRSEDKVPVLTKIQQHMNNFAEKINLKRMFAPSVIAAIVGLSVGVITPLRKLIIGDSAPLRVLESSATLVGEAAIPSITLILGANLLKGLKRSEIGLWVLIGINVVRYIALPLCGILVVKGANHFGLVGTDALYQFVLLLQYALPSAMNIGTITQLFEVGESECSVIMLWNYAVASLFLTLWTAYFMWLVS